nr:hypothetical protein [uncultured Chryseobacterium sp.]
MIDLQLAQVFQTFSALIKNADTKIIGGADQLTVLNCIELEGEIVNNGQKKKESSSTVANRKTYFMNHLNSDNGEIS